MVCPRIARSLLAALLLQPVGIAQAQQFDDEESIRFARVVVDTTMDGAHFAIPADFDGDGDRDLVATSELTATVAWYENLGGLEFMRHDIDTDLGSAYPASVKDLDRDGDLDVLACGYRADICVWYENDGLGTFVRHDIAQIMGLIPLLQAISTKIAIWISWSPARTTARFISSSMTEHSAFSVASSIETYG